MKKQLVGTATLMILLVGCRTIPTQAPLPTDAVLGDTWIRLNDGMVMVYVPAGEFVMGSTDAEIDTLFAWCEQLYGSGECQRSWYEDESPTHTVVLDSYWIDQTEVTNAQYAQCVEAGACDPPARTHSGYYRSPQFTIDTYYGDSAYDTYPVIWINWYEASIYCEWGGARLPTEAEWEYAARGPKGWRYPWGDEFDGTRLNYCDVNCDDRQADRTFDDSHSVTAPVRSYAAGASWCGVLNTVGNVWEWVADGYGEYPSGRQMNPGGPSSGDKRVLRGGAWGGGPISVRGAERSGYRPRIHDSFVGFRCASSPGGFEEVDRWGDH